MSTTWQYTPVSSRDTGLIPRNEPLESTPSADSLEDVRKHPQHGRIGVVKSHKEDNSQTTFTNVDATDILEIPNWPSPKTLEAARRECILRSMGYILLLIPPLFFLVLVLSAIALHSHGQSSFGTFVTQACLLGPTAFPIAFSAILGWCLRTYGRYTSERGVKLGELERVIGSQTVFSFLRFAIMFRKIDRLCVVLGILWALSPLGGQGILRMLSTRPVDLESTEAIDYFNLYSASEFQDPRFIQFYGTAVNGLYLASLYGPIEVKNRTTDLWGAIKIPSIEDLDFDHQDDDGVAVGNVTTYTSLIGIPTNSTVYKTATNYTFTLNATAFTTQCQDPKTINATNAPRPKDRASFVLETRASGPRIYEVTERNISLITFLDQQAVIHNCTLVPHCLLAKVECSSGQCGVTRIKKLAIPIDELPPHMLAQDTWPDIVQELPKSTGIDFGGKSSQTELYLYSPHQLKPNYTGQNVDLREVPIAEFSRRFATLLNTYYQATLSPVFRMQSLSPADKYTRIYQLKTTEAVVHTLSPDTYQRHWEWVISAFVASLTMLGVAVTAIWFERRVISPDIYGYVSTMTRDNPYFPLPPTGCTLDGAERAVLLRDVVVRVEDVAPDKEVGHIAFTMAGYKTPTQQSIDSRLRRTKTYSGCPRDR